MSAPAAAQELSARRRVLILGICCLSLLIVGMDNTIVTLGLRTIKQDLHASLTDLQWTIDAYTVVVASLLMLAGSTADRLGRRRIFQTGLTVFALGSLLCSLAPSLGWLVGFRALQAVGGSMLNPVAMSIITNVFTEPRDRARAIGVWGGVIGLSYGFGPIIGGVLIGSLGWRSIFWINVPIGAVAFLLAARFVPESRAARPRRPDPFGQLLVIAFLGGLTFAIIESPRSGWDSVRTLTALSLAVAAVVTFIGYEPRRNEPLVDLRFFRSAPFTGATLIAVCAFAEWAGFLFTISLYLQGVRGLTPLSAGMWMVPLGLMTVTFAPLSGRLVANRGPRIPLVWAGLLLGCGGLLLVPTTPHESFARLVLSMCVLGVGFALVNAPITNTAVSGMPDAQAGVAAAIASTSRQIGASLGVAIVGSVLAAGAAGDLAAHFDAAGRTAWWVISAFGFTVLLLGVLSTTHRATASAARTAARVSGAG